MPSTISHTSISNSSDRLGLTGITLLGHSIGGWTAAEIATKSTSAIARLVLVAPVGIKVGPVDKLDIPDIYAMSDDQVERLLYAEPDKWRRDRTKMTDADLLVLARNRQTLALITWEPYMHNPKLKHRLHAINVPTLMIRGAQDGLVSGEYAAAYTKLIPGATLTTIDGAGHSPQIEQTERFVQEVERFAGMSRKHGPNLQQRLHFKRDSHENLALQRDRLSLSARSGEL